MLVPPQISELHKAASRVVPRAAVVLSAEQGVIEVLPCLLKDVHLVWDQMQVTNHCKAEALQAPAGEQTRLLSGLDCYMPTSVA